MTVKVGDEVVLFRTHIDIKKGNTYKVIDVREYGVIDVVDGDGGEKTMYAGEYQLVRCSDDNPQYIRILEAIVGPDVVKMARNINEALKDAS